MARKKVQATYIASAVVRTACTGQILAECPLLTPLYGTYLDFGSEKRGLSREEPFYDTSL